MRPERERVHLHPKGVDWMLPHHCTACRKRKREEEATAALSLTDRGSDLARQRQRCRPRCCCLTLGMDGAEGRSERSARARKASVGGALFRSRIIKKRKPHGLARLICLAMTDNGWSGWDCNVNRLHLRITSSSSQTHRQRRRRLCNIGSPFPLPPLPLRRLGLARATVRASERVH